MNRDKDVVLTTGLLERLSEVDGTSLILTKFKGRWFTTVRAANGRLVHATANGENLQKCLSELENSNMTLKRPRIEQVEEIVNDEQVNKFIRRVWKSVKDNI